MAVRGSVDSVSGTEVRGWAFSAEQAAPVVVQAVLNHEVLGEALANIHRPDLAAAGLGDGNAGYVIRLFRPVDHLSVPFIAVKLDGGDAELPRAPVLGFGEFFTGLYRSHPSAGRSRSVFGGLWTDRTDAAALLRGKIEIGQVAGALAPALAALIHGGLAITKLHAAPPASGLPAERLAAVSQDAALLPLLRAVFEDHPLVVRAAAVVPAGFAQPSSGNPSPSPAECLAVVTPLAEAVVLEVVRDSHRLPEFTPHGVSRWASGAAADGVAVAGDQGLLDVFSVAVGSAVVVGAGTLFRVRDRALVALCLPARAMPMALAEEPTPSIVERRSNRSGLGIG